ncbi:tetratricopeptide repeat protein [Thermodesulfobacteriota bacterium]
MVAGKLTEFLNKIRQKNQLDQAIKEHRKILDRNPSQIRVRQKLGELYARKGDNEQAISHLLGAANAYRNTGFMAKAIVVFKQILRMDPDDREATLNLAKLYHQGDLLADALEYYRKTAEILRKNGEESESLEMFAKIDETSLNIDYKVNLIGVALGNESSDAIVRNAVKFLEGIAGSDLETFADILAMIESVFPTSTELHKKKIEIFGRMGRNEDRLQAIDRLEDLYGQLGVLEEHAREIAKYREGISEPPPAESTDGGEADEPPSAEEAPTVEPEAEESPEIALDDEDFEEREGVEPGSGDQAVNEIDSLVQRWEQETEADIRAGEAAEDIGSGEARKKEPQEAGGMSLERESEESGLIEWEPDELAEETTTVSMPPEVDEIGFDDVPIGETGGVEVEAVEDTPAPGLEAEVDKARLVVDSGTPPSIEDDDLGRVLGDFKEKMDEQVDDSDYETHYNLGIAYKEMELFDEAVREFKKCLYDEGHAVDALLEIGSCYNMMGRAEEAVAEMERGLLMQGVTQDHLIALKYELGLSYQMLGRGREAIEIFNEILEVDPSYRDVGERLNRIEEESPTSGEG